MSPMKQMSRAFKFRSATYLLGMAVMLLAVAGCVTAWAQQEPGSAPEIPGQAGPPRPDLGPRSLPRQGYPDGLPPHPRSQDERFRNGQMQQPGSQIPPTPPTQAPLPPSSTAMPSTVEATALATTLNSSKPRYAHVSFHDGLLDVRADDSSLQQILRSIARRTGMKITGGVADQRVFGNYGPAPAPTVLATLLDGTGVNMLLRTTPDAVPEELVLTPQTGMVSAPNLDLTVNDEEGNDESGQSAHQPPAAVAQQAPAQAPILSQTSTSGPVSVPQPMNNVNGSENNTSPTASTLPTTDSVPLSALPTPSTTPSSTGIVDAPNPPPPGSTTSQSPNGVATPESIYQQLMQLQKQKQNGTPATPANGSTPP